MPPLTDSPALRFLASAGDPLDEVHDLDKALKLALRVAREAFRAEEACFARAVPGQPHVQVALALPAEARWDVAELVSLPRSIANNPPH